MDDKTTILTKISLYIFIDNKVNLCFSALCACLIHLFYKQDLTYTIICFIGLFSAFCLLKECVSFCKRKVIQYHKTKEEQLKNYQEVEKVMKLAVIQTLNNEHNIELFKQSLNKTIFLSDKDSVFYTFYSFNELINTYNLYPFNNYDVLDIDNIDGGIEFRVKPNLVPYIRTFFKKHKNDYMKFVFMKCSNDNTQTNEENKNCETIIENDENKNEHIKNTIKEAIIEANAEMQKPQIVEYKKIPIKGKLNRIFCLIFFQKKLNGNPDLPFAMLQMLSGDMLSIFKCFLYFIAVIFVIAGITSIIVCAKTFSILKLLTILLFFAFATLSFLIGRILNKTIDTMSKYQYDKNITLGLFSAFIALLSLVIAFISLLKQ